MIKNRLRFNLRQKRNYLSRRKFLENEIELVWSYILDYENKFNPFVERKNTITEWKKLTTVNVEEEVQIIKEATELKKKGVKSKDALHIACAVFAECDYFLTTDQELLKKSKSYKKIEVINPINLLTIIED